LESSPGEATISAIVFHHAGATYDGVGETSGIWI
jgi:hypothetical protein